jgi:hypothetical protein
MKRNRRPLPIPQHEFCFIVATFRLFSETGAGGDRSAREQGEADRARRAAEAAQARLFPSQPSK